MGRKKSILSAMLAALSLVIVAGWLLTARALDTRVMILGLDGATWHVIERLLEEDKLPNLRGLMARGIYGDLISSPPILSPIVWTTIFTGKSAKIHGVDSWDHSTSTHRRCKALWNITSERGFETIVINVPGTWPPEEIKGVMVSGFPISGSQIGGGTGVVLPKTRLSRGKLPPHYAGASTEIAAAIERLAVGRWSQWIKVAGQGSRRWKGMFKIKRMSKARYYLSPVYRYDSGIVLTQPRSLQEQLERKLGIPYVPEGPGWSRWKDPEQPAYLYDHLVDISRLQTSAALFLLDRPWDVFIYVLTLTDRVQHPYWSFMEPENFANVDPDLVKRFKDRVARSYKEADREIGEILKEAGKKTYVLVVSDHGFRPSPHREKNIGEHDFTGIYIVSGPGLSSLHGKTAHIADITPTVLYLLNQPVGADMKGTVMADVARQLERRPVKTATYEGRARNFTSKPVDEGVNKQLRSLGYIDN